MKIRALFVAPYPGLLHVAERLRDVLEDFELTIMESDLYELKPRLPEIIAGGYDVLISRGGTARMLRRETDLPVSEIPITGFDMVRTLTLIKGYPGKIQMIGFPNVIERFSSMSDVLNVDVTYVPIQKEGQVDAALQLAKDEGVPVIVGDTFTVGKAAALGFQAILITSGEEAVRDALENARQLAAIRRSEAARSSQYMALLEQSDTGLAIIQSDGTLHHANQAFHRLLDRSAVEASIATWMQAIHTGVMDGEVLPLYDHRYRMNITGGYLMDHTESLYWIRVAPSEKEGHYAAYIDRSERMMASNWTLSASEPVIRELGQSRYALCGETGVGKRAYAVAQLADVQSDPLLMLRIAPQPATVVDIAQLHRWISTVSAGQWIYLDGLEHLHEEAQEGLLRTVRASSVQVICALSDTPAQLVEQHRLTISWAHYFGDTVLVFPPLREQRDRLLDWIRLYVSAANERHGKQIVGLRPEVIAVLHEESWPDNLNGLQRRVEQWVIRSQGPYIALDDLREDDAAPAITAQHASMSPFWQGTLHEMEQRFIGWVLEEEQMNATRAAKRLGINRTTLWRKLKQQD